MEGQQRPRFRPLRVVVAWVVSAAALALAAWIVPGVSIHGWRGALLAAALIATLNAILPPIVAALRVPYPLVLGVVLVLLVDAAMFRLASSIAPSAITVDSAGAALAAAFVASIFS